MATRKYVKKSCHNTKAAANKEAKRLRANGYTAQVKKKDGKSCVYSAGKRKK